MGVAYHLRSAALDRLARSCIARGEPQHWTRWLLEEMRFEWREAEAIADEAMACWADLRTAEAYAVYRATQDRADAAQDELAAFVDAHAPLPQAA